MLLFSFLLSFLPSFLSPSLPFALSSFLPAFHWPSHPFSLPSIGPLILSPSLSSFLTPFSLPFPSLPDFPFPSFLPLFFTLHSLNSFVILPFLPPTFFPFFHPFLLFFFSFFRSQRNLALCDSSIADCLAVVKMSRGGMKV